jgi:hypothetical protein
MTARSNWRGRTIKRRNGQWVYADTGGPVGRHQRSCGRCHKLPTAEGHDACLGTLAGVRNACCGHGVEAAAYVQLDDGSVHRRQAALEFIQGLSNETE